MGRTSAHDVLLAAAAALGAVVEVGAGDVRGGLKRLASVPQAAADALPIFDAHLHYSHDAWSVVPPREVVEILKKAGISLAPSKQSMVYSRLARRLRATHHTKFVDYLNLLENNAHNPEWEHFTNALTTNLTSFYREAHHFDILTRQLHNLSHKSRIEIWCSAASTGEEPYTLAITAMEAFGSVSPPVRILATDIDTKCLETARKGVYRMDQVEKIPKEILKKYFLKGNGESEGLIRVRPEVQKLITFRQLNLLSDNWNLRSGFDAIFCRNVMIYFEKDVQMEILRRFAPLMSKDGLLYAGHSENFAMARDYFTLKGKTVYVVNPSAAGKS